MFMSTSLYVCDTSGCETAEYYRWKVVKFKIHIFHAWKGMENKILCMMKLQPDIKNTKILI